MPHRPDVRRLVLAACVAYASALPSAFAEKTDKDKTINFSAEQPLEVDIEKRAGTAKGNVVITQGTITIKADRIDFKQNADNSLYATAYGNPLSFRQKKDDSDEYYEGFAQKAVYDGSKDVLELFDRGLLKDGKNELRGNYIWYNNTTSQMRVEGRPDAPNVTDGPGNRVRGTFEPRSEASAKAGAKDEKSDKDKAPSKDKADGKDKSTGKSAATRAKSAPITLKPADAAPKSQ